MPDAVVFQGGAFQVGAFQGVSEAEAFASLTVICRIYDRSYFESILGHGAAERAYSVEVDTPTEEIRELEKRSLDKGGIP